MRERSLHNLHETPDEALAGALEGDEALLFRDGEGVVVAAAGLEAESALPDVGHEDDSDEEATISTPFDLEDSDYFVT